MTIHPDLLKACAAYLAHADIYDLDEAGALELFRPTAAALVANRAVDVDEHERQWPDFDIRSKADALTRAHLDAIKSYAIKQVERTKTGRAARAEIPRRIAKVTFAIFDATPAMLAWWCETLAGDER